ncbi:15463_t:CDS:2 [Entrophospora sp. SA101]|nr:15463_t:CDS:2 [Entrophospora sp. SA101]
MKELKNGYDISNDFLSKIEAHFQCFYEDQKSITQKLLRLYGITQNPETKNYIIVMDYKEANLRNSLDNKIQESLESQQSHWTSRIEILFNISTGFWYDSLFGHGLFPNRREEAVALKVHFEPFGDIQIESSYTLHKGACYTRRTFDFSQFSEPKNRKDHYIYPQL